MKRRNPQELDEHLAPGTVCQLYGGFEDGSRFLVPNDVHELRLPTRCGKQELMAVYLRIPGNRFDFWKYDEGAK